MTPSHPYSAHTRGEDSVADDLLRSGYERWLRLEEAKAEIGDDLKELFAELKANGLAPKALRESFRRVRKINDADQLEHDAVVDLYVASLVGARPAHDARENIEEFGADARAERSKKRMSESMADHKAFSAELAAAGMISEEAHQENIILADGLANKLGVGAMDAFDADGVIIEPAETILQAPLGSADETSPVSSATNEPDAAADTSGDYLREPVAAAPGQIIQEGDAPLEAGNGEAREGVHLVSNSPETAPSSASVETKSGIGSARDASAMLHPGVVDGPTTIALQAGTVVTAGETAKDAAGTSTVAVPAASTYAAPGVVVMTKTLYRGYVAHPYIVCWPHHEMKLADGEEIREPIVMVENFLVDGRKRYFAARDAHIAYPVVQYAGDDLLMDVIRWNLASRTTAAPGLRMVMQKLVKLEPGRDVDIEAAFAPFLGIKDAA